MKKLLLLTFLSLAIPLFSSLAEASRPVAVSFDISPTVYPNPASDFISLSNEEAVQQMVIYNFGGRQVLTFTASKGQRYDISGLPDGMYLVQFLNPQNKIIHTQRLQKR
jgi:hypothetical protein